MIVKSVRLVISVVWVLFLVFLITLRVARAESDDINVLVRVGTFENIPEESAFRCRGYMDFDFTEGLKMEYTLEFCVQTFGYDFSEIPTAPDIPLKVGNEIVLISNLGGSTATMLDLIVHRDAEPPIEPPPDNVFCDFARINDPGAGLYAPTPECEDLLLYDGSYGDLTRIPTCLGERNTLPNRCTGPASIKGEKIYSERLLWADRGSNKELFGFAQITTINTMGSGLSQYKNGIIAIRKIPGHFGIDDACADLTASENSAVTVIQSDSDNAINRPGKYCALDVGEMYYINTMLFGEHQIDCGKVNEGQFIQCRFDVVRQLPDIS